MRFSLTRKQGILLGIGLILFGAGLAITALIVSWANQPVVQTIRQQDAAAALEIPQSQTIRTKFYTALVPGDYQVQVSVNPSNANMVQAVAFGNTSPKMQLGITTNLIPSDGLKGVADYNLRSTTKSQYETITNEHFPPGSKAFRKITGTPEIALFITNNARYASIVATGSATEEQLQALLTSFYDTWVWL